MAETVGIIGLGLVGTAIAERLQAEGFGVSGHDIDVARRSELGRLGAKLCASPADVAGGCGRVVLSLPDSDAVTEVIEGDGGILSSEVLPEYVIDTTTGEPERTEATAEMLAGRGVALLDATISGSSEQVRAREAVVMAGGSEEAFEACRDIMSAFAGRVFHVGASGSGSRAKLASNLVLGLNRAALAEGLVFGVSLGLDAGRFLELLKSTAAYSAVMDTKGSKMVDGEFSVEARLRQHLKDVLLILRYGEKAGQKLPLSEVHRGLLQEAVAAGEGDLDNSAVIRVFERLRGG